MGEGKDACPCCCHCIIPGHWCEGIWAHTCQSPRHSLQLTVIVVTCFMDPSTGKQKRGKDMAWLALHNQLSTNPSANTAGWERNGQSLLSGMPDPTGPDP